MIFDKDDGGSTQLGYDPSLKPEMAKTKSKLQQRPRRSSQPIPIEKSRPSPQEIEREAMSAESYLQYDMATWRMHNRITIARRLRAYSLSRSEDCHAAAARHELVQYYYQHRLAQEHSDVDVTSTHSGHREQVEADAAEAEETEFTLHCPSNAEDESIEGVFILDLR